MNREMQIIREVNSEAEKFYDEAVKLGDHAAHALKARHRSQMTGLENIVESAFKTSDVFDYIKKQTARFSHWRQPDPESRDSKQGFGERLKEYLEKDLASKLTKLCEKPGIDLGDTDDTEKQERRRIYLLLMRQFIRQMVVQYEYRVSLGTSEGRSR
jgi:hypothetical protein